MSGLASSSDALEFIFLGTGTSSCLPNIHCLTRPRDEDPCRTCLSTLTPEGKKNIRRNTSAVMRTKAKDGRDVTIVIDSGKTFQAAAVEWFPKYGLRKIDALLITHAHADAMNGLDDLRGWTLKKSIQSHIDVYLSEATFTEVQRSFPYLVSKEFASGGGDVPDFVWHIIEDKVPFEIEDTGVYVTPFTVHHGRIFSQVPPPAYVPTPGTYTGGTTTPSERLSTGMDTLSLGLPKRVTTDVIHPYLCFGFRIQHQIVYLSDVSHIPENAWSIINERHEGRPLPLCILDCLNLNSHISHFGLEQSLATARKIGAERAYLIGFSHEVSHEEYVTITKAFGGEKTNEGALSDLEKRGLELIGPGDAEGCWVRPSHDGLRVVVSQNGEVRDESY